MRLITDQFSFAAKRVPKWNTISISGYHIREAGSTALQELAFTLRDGMEYVEYGVRRGPRRRRLRAAPLLLLQQPQRLLRGDRQVPRGAQDLGDGDARPLRREEPAQRGCCRFHTQTAGCSLTAQQPVNNVVRTAMQALAAVLGGTQSLHTNALDETLALPTEENARIALRTQQILAHESGVINTIDPLGGSWFVEEMTRAMVDGAFDYFRRIDELGGMVEAIEAGFPQREIMDAAFAYQRAVEKREKLVVGVNAFRGGRTKRRWRRSTSRTSSRTSRSPRSTGSSRRATAGPSSRTLDALRAGAEGEANTMPLILDCVKSYCTVGEISDAMRDVFGTYEEPAVF